MATVLYCIVCSFVDYGFNRVVISGRGLRGRESLRGQMVVMAVVVLRMERRIGGALGWGQVFKQEVDAP